MERPKVLAIVGWPLGGGEYYVRPQAGRGALVSEMGGAVTLEDAKHFAELGFEVIVDPWTQEELARYEQMERARAARINKPRWQQW